MKLLDLEAVVAADDAVVGAAHCGRLGLVAGIVPATVARMRALGAGGVEAWIGPHVCGRCYEVPGQLREGVANAVPTSYAETSWGTPSIDLGAGVRAQLEELDVDLVATPGVQVPATGDAVGVRLPRYRIYPR